MCVLVRGRIFEKDFDISVRDEKETLRTETERKGRKVI